MIKLLCSIIACATIITTESLPAGEIAGTVRLPQGVDGALSPAVVYVVTTHSAVSDSPQTVVVDQQNLQFVPRVQAVALGGSIRIRNSDREAHNVNCQSGCCTFNQMVGPAGELPLVQPTKAGLLRFLCNIHQHMRGFVMVCPNSMFAITDARGGFRIGDIPEGTQKVAVWQEFAKPFVQEVTVSGTSQVEFVLEPADGVQGQLRTTSSRPAVPWKEVRRGISEALEAATRAAQRPGGGHEAERLALDAYFEHFEASELETALRLFRGEGRVFDVERAFARIRKPLLADLAAGKGNEKAARDATANLLGMLDEDIRELEKRGIRDRTALNGLRPLSPSSPSDSAVHVDAHQVLSDLRKAFDEVERLVAAESPAAAASALADSYFQIFHRIEPVLAASNFPQMRKIECDFLELRGQLQASMTADEARAGLRTLWTEIELASSTMDRVQRTRLARGLNAFWNSFLILTREGVEALLIVTALLLYLNRMGQSRGRRAIYVGLIIAVVATVLTWFALQWLIAQSGIAQEAIEGASALAAAGVLFFVSYWLISKSEARRWQEFLTRRVGRSISTGSKWALATAAFLAVYREGAETILMFQPMLVHPASNELLGMVAGIGLAVASLFGIFLCLRFASFRLAIRPFFRVTGALLFVLAIVFAGKGVTELQEAGFLAIRPLPSSWGSAILSLPPSLRDTLGIGITIQSLIVQGTLLGGAVISLLAVWIVGRFVPIPATPAPVQQATRVTPSSLSRRSRSACPGSSTAHEIVSDPFMGGNNSWNKR